jgi:hypothetical protein
MEGKALKLKPLDDWMIVEEVVTEKSNIIKPINWKGKPVGGNQPVDPKPWKVLDIGPGVMFDGQRIPTGIKVGDVVVIAVQVIQTQFMGREYFISRASGVNFMVVEEDSNIPGVSVE